ncbi:MAG: DUF3426 domain-containing protein [Nitrosomonadales bacterium]|nr:MAG: DUF3426 domain-containing protein [Nitrosomonadales bacterium]
MALVTRCPNCASVFRVTPQHLQMQEGNVRCGHCSQIFNSFTDLATIQELGTDKSLQGSSEIEGTKKDIQNDTPKSTATEKPAKKELISETSDVANAEQEAYTFDAKQSPRPSRLWGLISIFLLVILSGQVIYLYRAELSVFAPDIRPYLEQYCEILNCKLPLSQQAEFLSIESSDMQMGATQQPEATQLTAIVRNQATSSQALPALELTLTDIQNRALASRIFTPGEYLEENSHLSKVIGPNNEISITLKIDSGDLNAAGYRLLLLYP